MMNLYDASAMVNMVLQSPDRADALVGEAVLDLAVYEVGSTMRHICQRKEKTADEAANLLDGMLTIMRGMVPLHIMGLERDVLDMSAKMNLTYYDAAYLAVAARAGLTLVADDRQLEDAARLENVSVVGGTALR